MPITKCLQQVTSDSRVCLLFLYRTKTIQQRSYSTFPAGQHANGERHTDWKNGIGNRSIKQRPGYVPYKKLASEERASSRSSLRPSPHSSVTPAPDDHIPFERPADQLDSRTQERKKYDIPFEWPEAEQNDGEGTNASETSGTVTEHEQKVFQQLLALSPRKESGHEVEQTSKLNEGLQRLLGGDISTVEEQIVKKQPVERARPKSQESLSDDAIEKKAEADLRRVGSLMRDARTDTRVWEILDEQVIARVLELALDRPEGASTNSNRKGKGKKSDAKKMSSGEQTTHDGLERQILIRNFSRHLLSFHDNLRTFPYSSLGLALLPCLRRLGPTAFALGASTELYNAHLALLAKQYLDIDAMVDTLEQMHDQVYEVDSGTYGIILSVLSRAHSARNYGSETEKALWSTEQVSASLRKLHQWSVQVKDQIEERALTEARVHEEMSNVGSAETAATSVSI